MNVLGTAFETFLRLLLLLSVSDRDEMSEDRIWMLDYLALYSRDFDMSDHNLHGYGAYRFGEYPAKRALAHEAIKSMVLDHFIEATPTDNGFRFSITREGLAFTDQFTTDYSEAYIEAAENVIRRTSALSDEEIATMVQTRATTDVEEIRNE